MPGFHTLKQEGYPLTATEVAVLDSIADLGDPGADRIMFWDESENAFAWLTAGAGLTITGTTITASAAVPAVITVADEATDTTCFPLFVTAATGDLGPKSNAGLTFNSATAELSATLLAGAFNGTVGATTPSTIVGTTITANTGIVPDANDGAYLGTTALSFSDLFLASGGVINWANGEITLTETDANTLTLAGGTLALGANNLTMTGSLAETGSRITKGWFTDLECTNAIAGSITGNAATVTNATLTTALTVNTGTLTLTANAANNSVLTIGAGAVSVSGANTGDQTTLTGISDTKANFDTACSDGNFLFVGDAPTAHAASHAVGGGDTVFPADPGADRYLMWDDDPGALVWAEVTGTGANTALSNLASVAINTTLVSDTDNTDALGTTAIAWSDLFLGNGAVITFNSAPSTADVTITHSANTLTIAGGDLALGANNLTMTGSIAATGNRVTKGWFTDVESTNMITVGGTSLSDTFVAKALYDAHTVLYATSDNTPAALSVTEQTLVGRLTGGNISAVALGIADNNVVQIDAADVADNDYAKFTAGGVEGRSYSEVLGDIGALGTAGGTMTGNITLAENVSIALDPAGSADGKYTGITVTGTAGTTVAFGDLITLDKDDSRWEKVDISVAAAATGDARGILGMAVSAGNDGDAITILLNGIIRADANFPALTIGAAVYASTTGDIVVTQPSTTDYVIRLVGYALTADEIYFNPENDWISHT